MAFEKPMKLNKMNSKRDNHVSRHVNLDLCQLEHIWFVFINWKSRENGIKEKNSQIAFVLQKKFVLLKFK